MVRVAVVGASGYAGGELLGILLGHPKVEIGVLAAGRSAGQRLGLHHRNLLALSDRILEPVHAVALADHDAVVLALPHGQSARVAALLPPDVVVLDAAADHRLVDAADWVRWYDGPHAGPWPYGLPELVTATGTGRDRLHGAHRIAVPGCYPTAVSLALAPGIAAGLLAPQDLVVVAASGTSGAGRSAAPHLLGAEVMGSMSPYGVGGAHRHVPEIVQNLSIHERATISFTPTLAPMPRGILATCTARTAASVEQLREVYGAAYADEPFVRLLPLGDWPRTGDVLGSNCASLQVSVDAAAGRAVVCCAIDNLTKGTAGAAVQCLNLAVGVPETTGLPLTGVAP